MKTFIRDHRPQYSYALNLNPADFMVQYSGVPGGKTQRLWEDSSIQDFEPHIVVLQCGSNDLCNNSRAPEDVCAELIRYCEHLINDTSVQHVVILQILQRLPPNRPIRYEVNTPWFNHRAFETNKLLIEACSANPKLTYYQHRGLSNSDTLQQAMLGDGVHLNVEIGYPKYFRNVRAAVMATFNKLRRIEQ